MRWKFEPLFSLEVLYDPRQALPGQPVGPLPARNFSLEPLPTTRRLLQRLSWVARSLPTSLLVLGEKIPAADGSLRLRGQPGAGEGLSFVLRLADPGLLLTTRPFMVREPSGELKPNDGLPAYSGRTRLLYFDNLNPAARPGGVLALTPGAVDLAQFASRAPTPWELTPIPSTRQLDVTPLAPQPRRQNVAVPDPPASRLVRLDLPENGYDLLQLPGRQRETVFLTGDTAPPDILGIVRIFPTADDPDWASFRRYQLLFEAA